MFSTLSQWWRRQLRSGRPSRSPHARRGSFRPRAEALEERCVPTTWFVTNSADNILAPGTLRYAVAHALNGDTIDILPAPFAPVGQHIVLTHGELYLNHSVTIQALGPAATIDGDQFSRIFEVAPAVQVKLLNLNIVNGVGVAHNSLGKSSLDGAGGGILNEGTLTVTACKLSFDTAKAGGGIYNEAGTLLVTGSTLSKDATSGGGGGVFNDRGAVAVGGSTFSFDSARDGGALATNLGAVTVSNSNLSGNSASIDGGALYNIGGRMTVVADLVQGNAAAQFGGGIFSELGRLTVSGASLFKNSAGVAGGGIASLRGTATVGKSNLSFNSALNGGGVYNYLANLAVTASHLDSNVAKVVGGGISNNQGSVLVTGSELAFNSAPKAGGIDNFLGTLKVQTTLFKMNMPDPIEGLWTDLGGNTFI
jgi:hypothetical protein